MSTQPYIVLLDPGPDTPPNPDGDPAALGVYASDPAAAAVTVLSCFPDLTSGPHLVRVCQPGPPPKTVHIYRIEKIPKSLEQKGGASYEKGRDPLPEVPYPDSVGDR